MTRHNAELPTLEINAPTCSHCGNDVTIEDGAAWCETCRVRWDDIEDGAQSEIDQDYGNDDERCGIEPAVMREEYAYAGKWVEINYEPCILPVSHDGGCKWPSEYTAIPITKEPSA